MNKCLGCLKQDIIKNYCPSCLRKLFRGKFPVLDLNKAEFQTFRYEFIDHFSISGVQDKVSLKMDKNRLVVTDRDGEYILKPVPDQHVPQFQSDIPANEHLTMQLANQVFKISTAENALILFKDGGPAYITKRFDIRNGERIRQEDFCQLGGKSPEADGHNFKYEGSYEEMAGIIDLYCSASKIEIEKLYKIILFSYMFGNGDAHHKNFSLLESVNEDFILSPAYDLICTSLHFPNESRMALDMFSSNESQHFKDNGFYGYEDFMKLAEIYGIKSSRAEKMIAVFSRQKEKVKALIKLSFLSEDAKGNYLAIYYDRLKALSLNKWNI